MAGLKELESVFTAVVELDPGARDSFLARRCPDPAMQARVRALLEAHATAAEVLPTPSAAQADDVDRAAGTRIGRFTIRRAIARGGMGVVYEADQDQPQRRVALKVLREGLAGPSAVDRFLREIEFLGRLDHPCIARLYDAGVEATDDLRGHLPWFAMEFVPGQPLMVAAEALSLDQDARAHLVERIAQGVAAAHERGVIHRDLKPANILVTADGDPRIVDFGVARAIDDGPGGQTTRGRLVGTVAYMSPEQLSGDPAAGDVRSDVYALGVILHELLVGRHPFPDEDTGRGLAARARPITSVPGLAGPRHRDLETVIAVALSPEPRDRYSSAHALAEDLRRIRRDEAISVRRPGVVERVARAVRRHRLRSGLVAVAGVAVLVGIVGLTWGLARADHHRRIAERERDQLVDSLALIDTVLLAVDPSRDGRQVTVAEVLDRAEADVDRLFATAPIARASLYITLGGARVFLGDLEDAARLYAQAIALRREHLGDDHFDTAEVIINGSRALSDEAAAELLPRARAVVERTVGPLDPMILRAITEERAALERLGRIDEAVQTLEAYALAHGADLDQETRCRLHLHEAQLDFSAGRFPAAIAHAEAGIRRMDGHPDREHRFTLGCRQMLVMAHASAGRPEVGLADAAALSAIMTRVLGAHHFAARSHIAIEATLLIELGRIDAAADVIAAAGLPVQPSPSAAPEAPLDPLIPAYAAVLWHQEGPEAAIPWLDVALNDRALVFFHRLSAARWMHGAATSAGRDDLAAAAALRARELAPGHPPVG